MLSDSAPRRRLLGTRHVSFLVARRGVSPLLSPSVILSCQFQIQIWLYAIHNYQTHITRSDGWRDLKETDFCTIVLLYKMWQTSTGWLAALDRKRIIIPSSYRNKFQIITYTLLCGWVCLAAFCKNVSLHVVQPTTRRSSLLAATVILECGGSCMDDAVLFII